MLSAHSFTGTLSRGHRDTRLSVPLFVYTSRLKPLFYKRLTVRQPSMLNHAKPRGLAMLQQKSAQHI